MSYIFLLELIVDDLDIFPQKIATHLDEPNKQSRGELCVRLQIGDLVRCEVCEKDFGSTVDLEPRKTGANGLFVYQPAIEMSEEPVFRISAHEKSPDGVKRLVGLWEEPGRKILQDLTCAFEKRNGAHRSSGGSKESLRSDNSNNSKRPSKPVSHTTKEMYPLRKSVEAEQSGIIGFAVVTIRMTCLGPNANQKVLFGKRNVLEPPVTCYKMEDESVIKCLTTEEPEDEQPIAPKASAASFQQTLAENKEEQLYDEYAAELNGNAICIRVEKDANIAVNIDGEEAQNGCTKGCWTSLTLPDRVYGLKEEFVQQQTNACQLPVVRGTLKYPVYHWSGDFMLAKKTTPVTIEDFRRKPDPTRTVGLQACTADEQLEKQLAGIEICRKGWHDPNVDVFVLKLGKQPQQDAGGSDPRHRIEIELRTPKGPTREIRPKETRGVQVLEEEFAPPQRPAPPPAVPVTPGGDAGVNGKKPTKPTGKKGKKK
ncbi:uncharacterized protein LOC131285285 [Anopheles ziemanni]|uniref:uncharacterized protein LOC131265450 n=1 Tax=Anopheles coustani TaxID=139045 RepID=UPI002657F234|nr:uncharacterized protein LOC131265450 [Anopheles coustani]XP_058170121.1 uncharacterized protein LOC131285285 [Anopheles ziemanni]